MYGFVFGLFSLALLFFYGMIHTLNFVRKMKCEHEHKRKYLKYAWMLGLYGFISSGLGIVVYYYGVG
ncbi:MAG: hypothetical protein ACK4M9_00450 [Anaerobacillus sp.]|uniref:hypothetical protein n=1 Tax=Anaerobacillus sp. TaxID=1872506 RepID=UPI00391AD117